MTSKTTPPDLDARKGPPVDDFPFGANADASPLDTAPDPFDPASLRLNGDAAAGLGVKRALLSVPVRKPDKSWFVRVHPDAGYTLETAVVELKEDRETYLVAQPLWPDLAGEATFSPGRCSRR